MNHLCEWKEFKLGDIFSQERGKEKAPNQNLSGNIILINEINSNNGFTRLVEPTCIFKKHAITISINCAQNVFYQDNDFCASVNIAIIRNKNLNKYNGLFIISILRKIYENYSYGYKISKEKIHNTLIKLPAKNNEPDWEFMSNYIKPLYEKINKKIQIKHKQNNNLTLNNNDWAEFKLKDLFEFYKGKRLTKADILTGNINFIGAISENNGVREKIDIDNWYQPNCITVNYNGSVGEAFYQSEPFWASDDVNVLYPKGWELNQYIAMFLITIIKANRYRFGYGRKWTLEKMQNTTIKLPIKSDNQPDWQKMESYIISLPYGNFI